ncbi:MAG: DUF2877 domain-containing protein [Chloroflexota bacterium]
MTQTAAGAFPQQRFAATRISDAIVAELLNAGREGIVEGVHRSALNIRCDGRLLTVAHESLGGLPNGVLIDPPIALDKIGIALGMPVQIDGVALRVPGASLVVLLSAAVSWPPAMPVVRGISQTERIERAERAMQLAADHAPRVGLGPLLVGIGDQQTNVGSLGRAAAGSLASAVEALDKGSSEQAVTAAYPLIGLGPGATPSGDDLLVGLAAGLAATDHPMARSFAAGVARQAVGLTTSVAESYLFHAGRLEFSERVHSAALAVLTSPQRDVPAAVTTALAWGASSGADLLVGLLVGIQAGAPGLAERLRVCATERNVAA